MRARIATLAVLAACVAVLAPPVWADSPSLSEAQGGRFPNKAFVLTLPQRKVLGAGDVTVEENGQPVQGLQVVPGDAAGARTFAVMLAIDTSESMRGAPIAAAMDAARQFASHRPAAQALGVVFFNRTARLALAPTTDSGRIAAALAAPPPLSRGTRIFDAAALALRDLRQGHPSVGSLVILSDGADVGSTLSPGAVVDATRQTKTRVFTVGLRSRSYDGSTLRGLAAATGGRYAEATPAQLGPLFAALGSEFGREYLVRYRSLAPLDSSIAVTATVAGVAGTATATYTSPQFAAPASRRLHDRGFLGSTGALVLASLVAALLLGAAVFNVLRVGRRSTAERITRFTAGGTAAPQIVPSVLDVAPDALNRQRRGRGPRWEAFAEDVDVAQIGAAPERLVGFSLVVAAIGVLVGIALHNVGVAVLLALAPVLMRMIVSARATRQRRTFESQLADNLQIIASAMRTGHSFVGALAVAVEDAGEPARREFQRTITDERLGVPLDEALARAARRMRSEELEYVGLVAMLQRDTGGNTAEVIDRVTETIRERAELKRLVRTLTAQGRLGGAIVTALPPGLAILFAIVRPNYFNPLIHNTLGVALIIIGAVMLIVGWFAIRKIVDIKV